MILKYFRNLGIICIALFSFFYTEKIANLTLEKNEIYQKIVRESPAYNIEAVNAEIDDNYITPGLNGQSISVKDSYYNMKNLNAFNDYYLVYDTSYPEVSIGGHKDKIITRGNSLKKSISFITEYDENIINFFHSEKIPVAILTSIDTFNVEEENEQLNYESDRYSSMESILNNYKKNTGICYLNEANENACRKKKKYLVESKKIIDNTSFIDIKNSVESGDIYLIKKGSSLANLRLVIKTINYKDLKIVPLTSIISEERD